MKTFFLTIVLLFASHLIFAQDQRSDSKPDQKKIDQQFKQEEEKEKVNPNEVKSASQGNNDLPKTESPEAQAEKRKAMIREQQAAAMRNQNATKYEPIKETK